MSVFNFVVSFLFHFAGTLKNSMLILSQSILAFMLSIHSFIWHRSQHPPTTHSLVPAMDGLTGGRKFEERENRTVLTTHCTSL
jgi:hypothetical protein